MIVVVLLGAHAARGRLITPNVPLQLLWSLYFKADNYRIGEQKTKQAFPFVMLKPTHGSVAGLVLFHSRPGQRKKRAFRAQHLTAATNRRFTRHVSEPNLEGVCSTERRALVAKFEGRTSR